MNKMRTTFKILFFIKKHRTLRNGESPIYLRITYNGSQAEFGIKRSTPETYWNQKLGRIKSNEIWAKELNHHLEHVQHQVYHAQVDLSIKHTFITAQLIKNNYLGTDQDHKTLIQTYSEHNTNLKSGIGITHSESTYKRHETTLSHIRKFLKKTNGRADIPLREINLHFVEKMERYFKIDRECNQNSTMKYLKNIRKITNFALRNGWIDKDPFVGFRFRYEKTEKPFLNLEEIERIRNKDLTHTKRLDIIRDVFLFCCYTGLAFIDSQQLQHKHIVLDPDGNRWIEKPRQKTKITSIIPLIDDAFSLIQKYSPIKRGINTEFLLPVPSNQKMNAYLKEVADLCSIDKILTTHVARHTFATTFGLAQGIPIEIVAKMLGHTSIRETTGYAIVEKSLISSYKDNINILSGSS